MIATTGGSGAGHDGAAKGRADDFLAPVLFALVARVRAEAERVATQAPLRRGPNGDPEAIHDLRVAMRRLRTVLRPARGLFGKRHVGALGDDLRRFARATGALRDEEVLCETLAALELPERARKDVTTWLALRARRERALRRRVAALIACKDPVLAGGPTLGEVLGGLERRLGHRKRHAPGATEMAETALGDAAAGVAELLEARPSDPAAMHELRIRYKRLRYTAELFAPVLGEAAMVVAKESASSTTSTRRCAACASRGASRTRRARPFGGPSPASAPTEVSRSRATSRASATSCGVMRGRKRPPDEDSLVRGSPRAFGCAAGRVSLVRPFSRGAAALRR